MVLRLEEMMMAMMAEGLSAREHLLDHLVTIYIFLLLRIHRFAEVVIERKYLASVFRARACNHGHVAQEDMIHAECPALPPQIG